MKKEINLLSLVLVGLATLFLSSCGIKPQNLEPPSTKTSSEDGSKTTNFPATYPKM